MIDTGANTVVNTGTLEAQGTGGLVVDSAVDNSGLLWADGGALSFEAAVTGAGQAQIDGAGSLTFEAAAHVDVTFASDAAGILTLDDALDFTGHVGGFGGNDRIDLGDLAFSGSATAHYAAAAADGSGGVLELSDGTHTAALQLHGAYDEAAFHLAGDGRGGTLLSYDPLHIL